MTISKEWFEHCKKSWYNEGYIDGEYNRDRQFKEPVSKDLEAEIKKAFLNNECSVTDAVSLSAFTRIARHFANWQKQQLVK